METASMEKTDQNVQEMNNLFSFQEFVVPVVH